MSLYCWTSCKTIFTEYHILQHSALIEAAVNVQYCRLLMNRVISFKNILSNEFQWLHYLIFWEALSKLPMAGVGEVAV